MPASRARGAVGRVTAPAPSQIAAGRLKAHAHRRDGVTRDASAQLKLARADLYQSAQGRGAPRTRQPAPGGLSPAEAAQSAGGRE